jgi:hypothetical protein
VENGNADAAEYVPMQPIYEDRFHLSPERARTQVRFVIRDQCDVGRSAATLNVVRTASGEDATFDAEVLFNHLESQQTRSFDRGDALGQASATISAPHDRPNAPLVTFGSYGTRQQSAKEPRRGIRDFLVKHKAVPYRPRIGIDTQRCGNCFLYRGTAEQRADEMIRCVPLRP